MTDTMLTLLIVSFLIGVGIASVLVLAFRSRRVLKDLNSGRGPDRELIDEDSMEGSIEGIEEARLLSRPGKGMPKPLSAKDSLGAGSINFGTGTSESRIAAASVEAETPGSIIAGLEPPEPMTPAPDIQSLHPMETHPPEDEGFSEPQLIETDRPPFDDSEGEEWEEEDQRAPTGDAPAAVSSEPESLPFQQGGPGEGGGGLLNQPSELVAKYKLPDLPLLESWRPPGSSESEGGEEADTTSPGIQLPPTFLDEWVEVQTAIDEEERKGGLILPETHFHLALLAFFAGEFESAVAYSQLTLDAGADPAAVLHLLGLTYHLQGYETEAEGRLREAAETKNVSPGDRATILTNLGLVSTYRRAPDDALGYFGQALDIHRRQGNKREAAETLSRMGRLCRAKQSLYEASKYHLESLEGWRTLGDRSKVALELRLMAAVFREKGDYTEAMKLSERALAMNRESDNVREEAINLGNIGLIYSLEKDFTKALEFFRTGLSLHRQVGNPKGEANNLGNIGNILFLQGQAEESLQSYLSALEINRKIGYSWGEAVDLGNIGKIQMHEKDRAAAGENLKEAHRIFTRLNATAQAEAIQSALDRISDGDAREP